jgi:glycerophosphoryl diester phosphodiesterase
MTLIGKDHSFVRRALVGVRAALTPTPATPPRDKPVTLLAHRGLTTSSPENTVAACRAAIEAGVGGVEVDLCVTRDGHVVLWHDRDPNALISRARQRGSDGGPFIPLVPADRRLKPISELTLEEVKEGFGYAKWEAPLVGGARVRIAEVETFDRLIEWLASEPRAKTVMLDVKLAVRETSRVPALLSALERALADHPELADRRLHLLCAERELFEVLRREQRKRALEGYRLTADFELPGVLETAREIGAWHIALGVTLRRSWAAVRNDVAYTVRARRRGELGSITVWTIDELDQLEELCQMGVDNVIVSDDVVTHDHRAVTCT